jgi:chromosome partitioning related protein ParA
VRKFGVLLADLGMRVLLVDADVQPSLSRYFEIGHGTQNGLSGMVREGNATAEFISSVVFTGSASPNLNAQKSTGNWTSSDQTPMMGRLQEYLANRSDKEVRIKKALQSHFVKENYDVVLIDSQGAKGVLQKSAIFASDLLISPICPDVLSSREFTLGTMEMLDDVESLPLKDFNMPPMKAVIYRTENTVDSRAIAQVIRESFMTMRGRVTVLNATVPHSVSYKKAATSQQPVHWIDPRASATMHNLIWEIFPNLEGITAADMVDDEPAPEPILRLLKQSLLEGVVVLHKTPESLTASRTRQAIGHCPRFT